MTQQAERAAREALKPCPFCGERGELLDVADCRVSCSNCGALGPERATHDFGSAHLWNTRALQSRPVEGEEAERAAQELLADVLESMGMKAAAFTLRRFGPVGEAFAAGVETLSKALQSIPVEGEEGNPRFFIDHGMIHDRLTGKHVTTEPDTDTWNGGTINDCLALLNGLASTRAAVLEEADLIRRIIAQAKADISAAHEEICKLQGLDPATHNWPVWSSPAHTLRWFDEIEASLPTPPLNPREES